MSFSIRPNLSLPGVAFLALVLSVTGLSCAMNQPLFVGSFYGWCGYGLLAIAALAVAAWRADDLALLPALLVVVVAASPHALPYSFGVLLFAAAFILARSARGEHVERLGRGAMFIAGLWCVYALLKWYFVSVVPAGEAQATANRLAGETWLTGNRWPAMVVPIGHANYTSGIGVILSPIFAGLAASGKQGRGWRFLWLVFAGLALALIVAGGSRAGLLAPAVACAGWLALAPASLITPRRKLQFFAAGGVLMAGAVMLHPHFRAWLADPGMIAYSDLVRRDYVQGCWAMFLERPLTGWGAGALPANFPPFNPPGGEFVSCYHAHTTPMQWLAEFGAGGVILFAAIGGLCLAAVRRVSRLTEGSGPVITGLVLAAAGYAVFSLFDYQTNIPGPGVLWGATLGIASTIVLPRKESASTNRMQKLSRILLIGGAGYAALIVMKEIPARRDVAGAGAAQSTDLPLAAREMADATGSAPDNAAIHGYAAIIYGRFALEKNSPQAGELADKEWERASFSAPGFPQLKTYRALQLSPVNPRKAVSLFKESLHDGPKFAPAWRGLAEAYFRAGERDAVVTTIALSMFVRPENAFDPALRGGSFGVAPGEVERRFDALVAEYGKEFPEDRFALRELNTVEKQLKAWRDAGGIPAAFMAANPTWSDRPAWRLLAKHLPLDATRPFDRPAAIRALTATVFASQAYLMSEAQAGVLLDQYLGKSGAPFSGVRTVATPESLLYFGSYLGVSDLTGIEFPSYDREDLLAYLLLYEGSAPRIRADKRFLTSRLDKLP